MSKQGTPMNKERIKKRISKGDVVIAIAGNNRGQTGTVLRRAGDRVIVQGLNVRKKHMKKSQQNPRGDIISIECPIHVSNLKIFIGEEKTPTNKEI